MVGRGLEAPAAAEASKSVRDERIVTEEVAKVTPPPSSSPEPLSYAQRLEAEKTEDGLEKPKPAEPGAKPGKETGGKPAKEAGTKLAPVSPPPSLVAKPSGAPTPAAATSPAASPAAAPTPTPAPAVTPKPAAATAAPKATPAPSAKPAPAVAKPTAEPKTAPAGPGPRPGTFTIQVGAFRDRNTADSVVARLKQKGYAAFVVPPEGDTGLFNVRVGSFPARADAEHVRTKLKDEGKFDPFIVKQ